MNTKPVKQQDVAPHHHWTGFRLGLMATVAFVTLTLTSCTKESPEVPPIETKPVEVAGRSIDHDATPSQVTIALLQAMAEDQQAARKGDKNAQKAAMDKTFGLAAYPAIEKAVLTRLNNNRDAKSAEITNLGDDRARRLYDYVKLWTPLAGHYLASVDKDPDKMADKLYEEIFDDGATVYCLLAHDPTATAPAERQETVLKVSLMKVKSGALSYWRVARLDYPGNKAKEYFNRPTSTKPASIQE